MSKRPRILITGASRGIGRAAALALKDDFHLILAGRDTAALEEFASTLPSAQVMPLDLASVPQIERDCASAREAGLFAESSGGLAGAVLSAGVWRGGRVDELSGEDWEAVLHLNVTAQAVLTRELLPALREGRGTAVFINSGSGFTSKPTNSVYSASKFALRALTDALREEEREYGVRISSVHPGRVATDMQRELRAFEGGEYAEGDYVSPQTVAAAIRFALTAGPEASVDEISVRPR